MLSSKTLIQRSSMLMPLSETHFDIVKLMDCLHNREMDNILMEIIKYTNFKSLSNVQKLKQEQFQMEVVLEQYRIQKLAFEQPPHHGPSA